MKQVTIDDMKKCIKENPVTKKYLDIGIEEYGLTENESLDIMITAWLDVQISRLEKGDVE